MEINRTEILYSSEEFYRLWNSLEKLGSLSEGECRRFNRVLAIKIFHEKSDKSSEYILKFKDLQTKVYIFAKKVVYIDNILSGYISRYFNGINLSFIDRKKIVFDELINACYEVYNENLYLSKQGIETIDIPFNILYKKGHFGIVDTCDYNYTDKESQILYNETCKIFNNTILDFLINSTFYEFVKSSKELRNEYNEILNSTDITPYLILLKKKLSEYFGFRVKSIGNAKKLISMSEDCLFPILDGDDDTNLEKINCKDICLKMSNISDISSYY